MNRVILVLFVLLSFILGSISNIFGECWYDDNPLDERPADNYDRQTSHYCEKIRSNFCYFPKSGYETLAPYNGGVTPINEKKSADFFGIFSSVYGGCYLSIIGSYPRNMISANFLPHEVGSFTSACRGGNLFSTKMDFTYGAYDKGNLIDKSEGVTKRILTGQKINHHSGYPLGSEISNFRNAVKNDINHDVYGRDIYTLRIIKAEIKDSKCPEPKHTLENRLISADTKLLLKLKPTTDDNIVYDDKETKKIEVNADQDEFYFGGTPLIPLSSYETASKSCRPVQKILNNWLVRSLSIMVQGLVKI